MNHSKKLISISHGSGGGMMEDLIEQVIVNSFPLKASKGGRGTDKLEDAGIVDIGDIKLAFTTDGCTVDPPFYPGGDIGQLAVGATINDLAMMGAKPLAMTLAYVIEEGTPIKFVERISKSVGKISKETGVPIITGDTKVMEKGKMDKVTINTAGIGLVQELVSDYGAKPGDFILVSGTMGDHGLALIAKRFGFETKLKSDTYPLWGMVSNLLKIGGIHAMKDPTRGGFAANINELARKSEVCFYVYENKIPLKKEARALSRVLGVDPLQTASEGKIIMAAAPDKAQELLTAMRKHPYGREAAIIGIVKKSPKKHVVLETLAGGKRRLESPIGEIYPRIC